MDTHPVRVGRENIIGQAVKGLSPGSNLPKIQKDQNQMEGQVMDETDKLKEIFVGLCNSAVKIFHSEEEVAPFIFIFPRDGQMIPIIPINGNKEAVSMMIQDICRRVGAVAGAIVSEAWSVTFGKEAKWDGIPPAEHPDRVEILQVSLYSKSINRMKAWKITRNGKTKCLEDYCGKDSPDRVESRFFGDYFRADA
jgi:hypothetical protein